MWQNCGVFAEAPTTADKPGESTTTPEGEGRMSKCFVVSPIGEPVSETRKRSDGFLREVIRPVAESCGFIVERADEDKAPGVVTDAIVQKIIDAELVIADLHNHNPNVMYEVAIRHATDKPLIQMIEHGEPLPFDIGGLNTVFYDSSVLGLDEWRTDLRKAIKAVQSGSTGTNPVARAGLFRALHAQQPSEGEAIGILADAVRMLRHEIADIRPSDFRERQAQTRLLLPPDQYVYSILSTFIDNHPVFRDTKFVLEVKDGTIFLGEVPLVSGQIGGAWRYQFKHEPEGRLADDLKAIKTRMIDDFKSSKR